MMGELVRIAALAIVAAVLISVLNQYEKTYAILATVAICCLFLLYTARLLEPLIGTFPHAVGTLQQRGFRICRQGSGDCGHHTGGGGYL